MTTLCKLDTSDIVSAYLAQLNTTAAGKELLAQLNVSQLHAIQHVVALAAANIVQGTQVEYAYIVTADCDDPTLPGAEDLHYVLHDHAEATALFSNLINGAASTLSNDQITDVMKRYHAIIEKVADADDWDGHEVVVKVGDVTVTIERTEAR